MSGNRKTVTIPAGTVAEAYLALLAQRGIDYLFANAGTDFVSIVEGLAKAKALGRAAPTPITAPVSPLGRLTRPHASLRYPG